MQCPSRCPVCDKSTQVRGLAHCHFLSALDCSVDTAFSDDVGICRYINSSRPASQTLEDLWSLDSRGPKHAFGAKGLCGI